MPEPTVLAYLAGVIDSDGYITITRSTRKGVQYFAAQVGIAGTRRQPHDLAASLWGGSVRRYVPKNPRHRAQFQWSKTGVAAAQIVMEIQPYLLVKQEQAALALEAQEHLMCGWGEDPFPWLGPDYHPSGYLNELREEMIRVLNQGRRMPLPDAERPQSVGVS